MRNVAAFAVLALAGCSAPVAIDRPARVAYETTQSLPASMTAIHNRERAAFGSPPSAWDEQLAGQARSYAAQLARLGRLQHSPKAQRPGQGENLAMGTAGYYSPQSLAGTWTAERRHFRPGIFPAVSRTGNWRDVGHFTQMVWPTSTRIGCGTATGRGLTFLVCRYAPSGNVDGRRVG